MPDIKTQGTLLQIEKTASPGEYETISGVYSIGGLGGGDSAEIDVTDFDSTAKEFLLGLKDEGTLSVSLNYDPDNTNHILLDTLRTSQASSGFKIALAAGTAKNFTFDAYVKSFEKTMEADDAVRGNLTLRITGAVTKGA